MKVLLVLSALLALVSPTCDKKDHAHNLRDLMMKVVEKYSGEPGVLNLKRRSGAEIREIEANFARCVAEADAVNADPTKTHSAEYNKLSIMTNAERAALVSNYNVSNMMLVERRKREERRGERSVDLVERGEAAASLDWVARGALNPVKNQGNCGSCWTFGAVAPLEANYYILTGEKKTFAEQEYLDCATLNDGHDGCEGGWMGFCYDYNKRTGHMSVMEDVPYKGSSIAQGYANTKTCKWQSQANGFSKAKVTDSHYVHDEEDLVSALQGGIVAVCIYATGTFGSYRSGVWDCDAANCNDKVNHAVVVTGYGKQSGIRYWNVRNSWGENWGDGGYIKMTRDGNGNVANIHKYAGVMPVFTCNPGQTCTTPEWDESTHEDDDIDVDKGEDVRCGILSHTSGLCLSIDDSADKWVDMSAVCEREWCLTDKGYLYEKATDLCANIYTNKDCKNEREDDGACDYWAKLGYCEHTYASYVQGECAETCGLCGERVRLQGVCTTKWSLDSSGITKEEEEAHERERKENEEECKDIRTNDDACAHWKAEGACDTYSNVKEECAKTCGVCTDTAKRSVSGKKNKKNKKKNKKNKKNKKKGHWKKKKEQERKEKERKEKEEKEKEEKEKEEEEEEEENGWGSVVHIKAEDGRCMQPMTGDLNDPMESTAISPNAACVSIFTFLAGNCWEVEDGLRLVSSGYGPGCWSKTSVAAAKEKCKELGDRCKGFNYSAYTKYYAISDTEEVAEALGEGDRMYRMVSCDAACNEGETRCKDGDCKPDCGEDDKSNTECDTSAGMRVCPDGTCKHEHMAC